MSHHAVLRHCKLVRSRRLPKTESLQVISYSADCALTLFSEESSQQAHNTRKRVRAAIRRKLAEAAKFAAALQIATPASLCFLHPLHTSGHLRVQVQNSLGASAGTDRDHASPALKLRKASSITLVEPLRSTQQLLHRTHMASSELGSGLWELSEAA